MVDSRLWGGMPEVGSGKRALSFLPLQYFDKKQRRGEKTWFGRRYENTQVNYPIPHYSLRLVTYQSLHLTKGLSSQLYVLVQRWLTYNLNLNQTSFTTEKLESMTDKIKGLNAFKILFLLKKKVFWTFSYSEISTVLSQSSVYWVPMSHFKLQYTCSIPRQNRVKIRKRTIFE